MTALHTRGGTDAPECTTCTPVRATARRPVRVTLEGEAYRPAGSDNVLMVELPSGLKVCLSEGLGITVEDIVPEYTWTDGDVIQHVGSSRVFSRGIDSDTWDASDDPAVDRGIANGTYRVLRHQAGDR